MTDDVRIMNESKLIVKKMLGIMHKKLKLRGTENIRKQGMMGVVNRMAEDKLARIKNSTERLHTVELLHKFGVNKSHIPKGLIEKQSEDSDSLEDDLMDVANYAIICILLLKKKW